ncbi:MAG TPA: hypothetical protein VGN63_05370 [Flavisolibacter sp.]|jgi:hypothetical protein|nr:hypothetical protein [Flavisolibacter sp.]
MLSKTDLTKVYETLLSIPGMNEVVKIDLKLPRKQVLLLSKVIERGLTENGDEKEPSILQLATPEVRTELGKVVDDLLQKGGLTEMNEKLKSFE